MGNFVSTQVDNQNLIGGVAKVTLEKKADGTCGVTGCTFVPTVTHKGIGANMTTYLLRDYTDELAASSYNPNLTPEYATQFCAEVLGSEFDTETKVMQVRL